jgi:hypothetical protein
MECRGDATKCVCTCRCDRRGNCCACVAYHRPRGEFPACFFSVAAEKSYDRTFDRLVGDRQMA